MTDEAKKDDPWANLALNLGVHESEPAAPPAETPEPTETPEPVEKAKVALPSVPQELPPINRPPSGWDNLAESFGLPVEEPATPPATAPRGEVTKAPAAKEPAEPRPPRSSQQAAEPAAPATAQPPQTPPTEPPKSEASPAAIQPQATSIFATGSLTLPDWFPFGGKRQRSQPEPAAADNTLPDACSAAESTPDEAANDAIAANAIVDAKTEDEEAVDQDTTASDDAPAAKKGRRRGRRRGRGRRGAAETANRPAESSDKAAANTAAKVEDVEIDDDEDEDEEDTADDETTEQSPSQTTSEKGRSPSHRGIPSWQEAIGVVVDANIAAHGERKRTFRGSGRGGTSRGGGSRSGGRGGQSRGPRKKKDA